MVRSDVIGWFDLLFRGTLINVPLRLFFIFIALFTFLLIIRAVQKSKVRIDDIINWIVFTGIWVFIIIFMDFDFISSITKDLGFESPASAIYIAMIGFLYILTFYQTLNVSKHKENTKILAQKIALLEKKLEDEFNKKKN